LSSWTQARKFDLIVRSFGDELLVYHTGSGETHCLNGNACAVFRALAESELPLSAGHIKTQCLNGGTENDAQRLLEELAALHLVEHVD
jgi:hypothetical protein